MLSFSAKQGGNGLELKMLDPSNRFNIQACKWDRYNTFLSYIIELSGGGWNQSPSSGVKYWS